MVETASTTPVAEAHVNAQNTEADDLGTGNNGIVHSRTDSSGRKIVLQPYKGRGQDAQAWMLNFETVANYLEWSVPQAIKEFSVSMHDDAARWWHGLDPSCKMDRDVLKEEFTTYFAGGMTSGEAAMAKIEQLKQGTMPMYQFGTRLKSLLTQAQRDMAEHVRLHFFYTHAKPELAAKVRELGPRTLEDAVKQGIRIEEARRRTNKKPSLSHTQVPLSLPPGSSNESQPPPPPPQDEDGDVEMKLNSQRTQRQGKPGTCYYCGKYSHWAKVCRNRPGSKRSKKGHKQNAQHANTTQTTPENIISTSNYFERALQNTMRIQNSQNTSARFFVSVTINGQVFEMLVDTGSDITTATADVVEQFGEVQRVPTSTLSIVYGDDTSTQTSSEAVTVDRFSIQNQAYSASFRIVQHQNPSIILGMDWLQQQDLLLDPIDHILLPRTKSKKVAAHVPAQRSPQECDILLRKYPSVIEISDKQSVIKGPVEHHIDTGDSPPVATADYRRSPKEREIIHQEVQDMLKRGIIEPSVSDWASPLVVVDKGDGSYRMCANYKRLNQVTRKDKYPLPRVEDLLDRLGGSSIFSTIDLRSGYWQIPMAAKRQVQNSFLC